MLTVETRNRLTRAGQGLTFAAMMIMACVPLTAADEAPEDWIIRGGHQGDSSDFSPLPYMADMGMNSIFVSMGGHLLGNDRQLSDQLGDVELEILNQWQQATEAHGMRFFPMVELYGTGDAKRWPPKRTYVNAEGRAMKMPCPNDPDTWQQRLTPMYVEIARWAKQQPNVPGIIMDTEMYGGERTGYVDTCYCDDCRAEVAELLGVPLDRLILDSDSKRNRYRDASTELTRRHAEKMRQAVREVYPECLLGGYLFDCLHGDDARGTTPSFYRGATLGWGTPDQPVLVFSEATYENGFHTIVEDGLALQGDSPRYIEGWKRRWEDWGAHAQMVVGIWITTVPPENIAETFYHSGVHTRGYWVYDTGSLGDNPRDTMQLPEQGRETYFPAIALANEELDRWVESDGEYISDLKVRRYTQPAAGIDTDKWRAVELTKTATGRGGADFFFYRDQQMIYLPADAGDRVSVRIDISTVSSGRTNPKRDAVGIVLLDPAGQTLTREKFTTEDLAGTVNRKGYFTGSHEVEFVADQTGTYCIALNGTRYAYTIGDSTHPWLVEAARDNTISLWFPEKFYVKTIPNGKSDVSLYLKPEASGRIAIFDQAGNELLREELIGGQPSPLSLPIDGREQVLTVRLDGVRTFHWPGSDDLLPWIAGLPDAAFPETRTAVGD